MPLKMYKKAIIILVTLMALGHLYYGLTGDFSLNHILPQSEYSSVTEVPSLQGNEYSEVQKILNQPFTYLGQGNQSYAFVSADGEYVLKFFKNEYLQRGWVKYIIPPIPPFRQFLIHRGKSREYRLKRMLEGYALSYAYDSENSGLLYFHLNQADPFSKVTVIDGLGFKDRVNIQEYVFALQKRVVVTKQELKQLLAAGEFEKVNLRISQLFALYHSQFEKGLIDRDRNVLDNTGFIEGRAVRHDVGKLEKREGEWEVEVDKIKHRLNLWISKKYPQYDFVSIALE